MKRLLRVKVGCDVLLKIVVECKGMGRRGFRAMELLVKLLLKVKVRFCVSRGLF